MERRKYFQIEHGISVVFHLPFFLFFHKILFLHNLKIFCTNYHWGKLIEQMEYDLIPHFFDKQQ